VVVCQCQEVRPYASLDQLFGVFAVFVSWIRGAGVQFDSERLGVVCVEFAIKLELVQLFDAVHLCEYLVNRANKVFVCWVKAEIVL